MNRHRIQPASSPYVVLVILYAVLMLAQPCAAQEDDAHEAFKKGVEALKDRRFAQAVGLLLQAKHYDGRESTAKVRTKWLVGGEPYLPYYYLGIAYAALGNCRDAVVAFEESEQQGVITGDRERYADLQVRNQACVDSGVLPGPRFSELLSEVQQTVDDVQQLANAVAALGERYPGAWRPELVKQYVKASTSVSTAADKLSSARQSRLGSELVAARTLAEQADAELRPLKEDIDAYVAGMDTNARSLEETAVALNDAEAADGAIENLLSGLPVRASLPATLAQAREESRAQIASLRSRSERARTSGNARESAELLQAARVVLERLKSIEADARTAITQQISAQFDAVASQTERLAADLEAALAALDSRLAAAPNLNADARARLTADRNRIGAQIEDAGRRLGRAREAKAARDLQRVRVQLSDAQTLLRGIETQVMAAEQASLPAALQAAAGHYLSGAYEQAVAALTAPAIAAITDTRWRFQAHLFRAAALFALSVLRSEADGALRARSATEVALCRELDGGFQPDAAAFSPRFLAFYKDAGL